VPARAEGELDPVAAEIAIRPVSSADDAAVHEMRRQPTVIEFTTSLPSERLEATRRFLESFGPDDHVLVAECRARVVGLAGLHVKRGKQRHSAEIGMLVHDRYQGRGVGRKLLQALLDLADNHLGLVRVELEVMADNPRAIRLYESCGFEHEGRKRRAILRRGGYVDLLIMGRTSGQPLTPTQSAAGSGGTNRSSQ
jgi:L-phenylalanine/L-methionine N-acetyltransferase